MKKYLTPRNVTYAVAAFVLVWLLMPAKKAAALVVTTTTPTPTPSAAFSSQMLRPENYVTTAPASASDKLGPQLREREMTPATDRSGLIDLQERYVPSTKTSLS
jgi:hypothetical protein